VIEIRHYVSRAGKDVVDDWLTQLADARTGEDCDPNQPACRRELWRLQIAAAGICTD